MKVLIFGATGGIGSELAKLFKNDKVIGLGSKDLNFYDQNFKNNLSGLTKYKRLLDESDIIINSAGVLGKSHDLYEKVFDVNFNSNWVLIKYFMDNLPKKIKKFVMIGSTSYNHGRSDYMLYSASKAALSNLFQGASKFFSGSNLILGLINPSGVKTNMTAGFKGEFIDPKDCAQRIFDFTEQLRESKSVDLD